MTETTRRPRFTRSRETEPQQQPTPEVLAPETTDLVAVVMENPAPVLLQRDKRDEFFEAVKAQTSQLVPDTSTAKGRDAIKAMAFKVTKMKTAIDADGKRLKEEAQATVTKVDAARKDIRDRLDDLAAEVRRPLTLWEQAEADRVKVCDAVIDQMRTAAVVQMDETSEAVRERADAIRAIILDVDQFRDRFDLAVEVRDGTVATLDAACARLVREEADRAELERLRREAAERAAAEVAEREVEEAQQRDIHEAEAAQARIREAAAAAEEAARLKAEEDARLEGEKIAAAHAAELAEVQLKLDEADAAERARQAEEKRLQDEAAKRSADTAHRARIMGEAKAAIMALGVEAETARAVVLALVAGEVPHCSLRF